MLKIKDLKELEKFGFRYNGPDTDIPEMEDSWYTYVWNIKRH